MKSSGCDILLIYPGGQMPKPRLPMSVLVLATHCKSQGYKCKIIDERINYLSDDDIKSAGIIGISTMSGLQLKSAIKTAKRIKDIRPSVPLIWGGVHPTSFPKQTAKSQLVDCVVKGEGEKPFLQLCDKIFNNKDYSEVVALTFERDGQIIDNQVADNWINIEELKFPNYDLLDIKKYADYEDGLSYETSRGCPFRCTFCYVENFHKRQWRGKSVDKVIRDITRIKNDIGVKKLVFVDDNFFGNKKRSLDICSQMSAKNIELRWNATARADFLAGCSEFDMKRLKNSGCEILSIGAESGSASILTKVKKDITTDQTKQAVAKCVENNIMPTVSFMIGLPFEKDSDLEDTMLLADQLMNMGKNVEINGLFIYVPYVGTSLFETALSYGYKPKNSLEKWSDWSFSDSRNNPWIKPRQRGKYDVISAIARFKYLYHRFEYYSAAYRKEKLKSPIARIAYRILIKPFARIVDWRWRNRYFAFAIEISIWKWLTYRMFKVK